MPGRCVGNQAVAQLTTQSLRTSECVLLIEQDRQFDADAARRTAIHDAAVQQFIVEHDHASRGEREQLHADGFGILVEDRLADAFLLLEMVLPVAAMRARLDAKSVRPRLGVNRHPDLEAVEARRHRTIAVAGVPEPFIGVDGADVGRLIRPTSRQFNSSWLMIALGPNCRRMRRKKPIRAKSATYLGSSSRVDLGHD